jgi:outer membrane protein OmpA-like peptidoglycan-associated protein
MKKLVFCLFSIIIALTFNRMQLLAQPSVKTKQFSKWDTIPEQPRKALKLAEKQFNKGALYSNDAINNYLLIYPYGSQIQTLNYKLGLSYLRSNKPALALPYLKLAAPAIDKKYYFNLANAYLYNNAFDSTIYAYEQYLNTLKKRQKKHQKNLIDKKMAECRRLEAAMNDSAPVFIINPGKLINSRYDDYGAVETSENDSITFFTSRRPVGKIDSYKTQKERIWYRSSGINDTTGQVKPASQLNSSQHIAIAGYSPATHQLFYYKGKRQHGLLFSSTIKDKKLVHKKTLKGSVKKIASKETTITIDDNGNAWFVSNRLGGIGGKDIWQCKKKGKNRYRHARNMGSLINTPDDEEGVFVSKDGNSLIFSSNGHEGLGGFDIYKTTKDANGKWGKPVNLGYPVNTPSDELFYRQSNDSLIALFSSNRQNGLGGLDIYQAMTDLRIPFTLTGLISDHITQKPLAATITIIDKLNNQQIAQIQQDTLKQSYSLHFEDNGNYQMIIEAPGYVAVKDSVKQATARHEIIKQDYLLQKIKYPVTITGQITDLYTKQPISGQIVFKLLNKDQVVAQTKTVENGMYSIDFEDKINLMAEASSNNYHSASYKLLLKNSDQSKIDFNIALKPNQVMFYVNGTITDKETGNPIKGNVKIYKTGTNNALNTVLNDSLSGNYSITHTEAGKYTIEANAEGYFFATSNIELTTDTISRNVNFALPKVKQGVTVVLENILFNSGKSVLLPKSFPGLDKLVNILNENKNVTVEISGHTDNVGNAQKNKALSKSRALAVKNYLIKKGIDAKRLIHEGYGSEQPIAANDTPEGKAANRRVELKFTE